MYFPLIIGAIQKDKVSSQVEKRNLAKLPALPKSIPEINDFPGQFNQYYADHFGLRELFTKAYFKIIKIINNSPISNDVTVGQDGWLFLGSITPGYTGYGDPMGDVTNINLYTELELQEFATTITKIKKWLDKRGIAYVYTIAPNKHTIYSDKLPEYISKKNKSSATDQLLNHLKSHTNVTVIDLRPALFEAKKSHQLYYKTDTHWNYMGANIAQFEIMKKIQTLFPGKITPTLLQPNQFETATNTGGDLAKFANIEKITEPDPQPEFKNSCAIANESSTDTYTTFCESQQLNALIFRDSFFTALQPYFSRKFKHTTFISKRINLNTLAKYIKINKPDIVIDEIVERTLPYLPINDGLHD